MCNIVLAMVLLYHVYRVEDSIHRLVRCRVIVSIRVQHGR